MHILSFTQAICEGKLWELMYKSEWQGLRQLKMIHKEEDLAPSRRKRTNTLPYVLIKISLKYHGYQHCIFQIMIDFSER